MILTRRAPLRRAAQRTQQRRKCFRLPFGPLRRNAQYLFRTGTPKRSLDRRDPSEAIRRCSRAPRFADAVTVDRAAWECVRHERGRDEDDLDIAVRVDAA